MGKAMPRYTMFSSTRGRITYSSNEENMKKLLKTQSKTEANEFFYFRDNAKSPEKYSLDGINWTDKNPNPEKP